MLQPHSPVPQASRLGRMVWKSAWSGLAACALIAASRPAPAVKAPPANPQVVMVVEKRGSITLELYSKDTPKTVAHFLELVNKKFYDGILFHRYAEREEAGKMIPFVIQAGDPKSKKVDGKLIADIPAEEVGPKFGLGDGGSGKTVPLEAKRPHDRGTLGMARSREKDSGDSQFFINLSPNHQLDEDYCVFGRVTKGMEVVTKIHQGDRIKSLRLVTGGKPKK